MLATVRAAGISALAESTTPALRLMLADMSLGLTKETALAAPKIFQLTKSLGQRDVTKLLVAILRAFVDSVKVPHKPDAADILEAADHLAITYTHDSLKDIMLALKEARTGGFKFYNSLDVGTIHEVIAAYFDRKAAYLEHRHADRKANGPSQDHALVEALARTDIATMVGRSIDPSHPNREKLRGKLSLIAQREKRGLITHEQARQQRREVEQAIKRHNSRTRANTTPTPN